MKKFTSFLLGICISSLSAQNADSLAVRKFYDYYLSNSKCYSNLGFLCNKIGNRLSGSVQAERAVAWAKKAMYEAGADTVILQKCMVPHWVRGQKEKSELSSASLKMNTTLNCLALGSSVALVQVVLKQKLKK